MSLPDITFRCLECGFETTDPVGYLDHREECGEPPIGGPMSRHPSTWPGSKVDPSAGHEATAIRAAMRAETQMGLSVNGPHRFTKLNGESAMQNVARDADEVYELEDEGIAIEMPEILSRKSISEWAPDGLLVGLVAGILLPPAILTVAAGALVDRLRKRTA